MDVDTLKAGDEPYMQFDKLHFRNYMPGEIKRLSILHVTALKTFDKIGQPVPDGLYDSRMGPNERFDACATCGLGELHCPGHVGHIELSVPVFNPLLFNFLLKLMKGTCIHCHSLCLDSTGEKAHMFMATIRCLELNRPDIIGELPWEFESLIGRMRDVATDAEMDGVLDDYIEKCAGVPIGKLIADSTNVKPHRTIVDLRYRYQTEFQQLIFKRTKKCPRCKGNNGSIFNDENRCLIFDFGGNKYQEDDDDKAAAAEDQEGEDNEKENPEIKRISEGNVISGNVSVTGAEALALQLKSITNGTCGKLAWRGAEVREHFRLVWKNCSRLLRKCFPMLDGIDDACPLDGLFSEFILVPPNKFRPIRMMAGDRYEHPATVSLRALMEANEGMKVSVLLADCTDREKKAELVEYARRLGVYNKFENRIMHLAYRNLQNKMNLIFDGAADKTIHLKQQVPGLKQVLEKKEGLFRMNMMGKRVNYACRSVITPDPYLDVDEVGIPEVFAKKLTFVEPVHYWNQQRMQDAVMNGPAKYPGANSLINANRNRIVLSADKELERFSQSRRLQITSTSELKMPCKVYRHVLKGDNFVMNRQPSLHKPSMMGHRARILPYQKALRLNYAPCKAYNADFDGDEMNGHLAQSYQAQSEVANIVNVGSNFLVPKDASPLLGLIQDHVVSGVLLTLRGRMLNREDFMHLVLAAFSENTQRLTIPPPCMIKPQRLWSGKQVISAIIINCIPADKPKINLEGKAKTSVKCWKARGFDAPSFNMSESEVVFREGELLCGVLDKNHFGASAYGLTHCCFELYGHKVGIQVLSCLSRLFTTYLQFHGFTLGVADILCLPEADRKRKKAVKASRKVGDAAVIATFNLAPDASKEEIRHVLASTYCNPKGIGAEAAALDRVVKQHVGPYNEKINNACVPDGLIRLFPENGLQLMIESGAKGSSVNAIQISCALGQIELEGKRMAVTMAGRTLPSFKAFDPTPRAGGFIDQRFLTGINPQELFFHTMAGREGLIDTAVKTSRSGYLQRCIIKHLEGIRVHYDSTCRDHDGSVIQFRYGEDGMDVCESTFLDSGSQFKFLQQNLNAVEKSVKSGDYEYGNMDLHLSEGHHAEVEAQIKMLASQPRRTLTGSNAGFYSFSAMYPGLKKADLVTKWLLMDTSEREAFRRNHTVKQLDTVNEALNPARTLGALPEKMLNGISKHCRDMNEKMARIEELRAASRSRLFSGDEELLHSEKLRRTLYWKGLKSMAPPGENVGLLAAQSIGEPSTQMTLNTFHFAGRGEMNVTLGIPRLREILMSSGKNIATPTAEIHFLPTVTSGDVDMVRRALDRLKLKQVIKSFNYQERVNFVRGSSWRHYVLRVDLLKKSKREKEAQHLGNRKILAMIEASSKSRVRPTDGEKVDKDEEWNTRGFIELLADVIERRMEAIGKQETLHITRVRAGNFQILTAGGDDAADDAGKSGMQAQLDEGESSDEEATGGNEADADENRLHARHRDDAAEYAGEEEERDAVAEEEEQEEPAQEWEGYPTSADETTDDEARPRPLTETQKADSERRRNNVLGLHKRGMIVDYKFDEKRNNWFEVTLELPYSSRSKIDLTSIVQTVIDEFIVHGVKDIEKCVYDDERNVLSTQGVNREALFEFARLFDLNSFYSNNLNYMLNTYGVEACARAIVKEMSAVFGVYGIRPSKRHLTLTADYMVFTGALQPFNRGAINSSASPLQKMTFETTIDFMRKALIAGEVDTLNSPSSRIVVGALNRGGTGAFDLFINPSQVNDYVPMGVVRRRKP